MSNEMKFAEWVSENHYVLIDIDKYGNRIWKNETKTLDTKLLYRKFKNEQMKDSIVESVIEQFKQRSEVGKVKYGITLDRTDLSALQWMIHFREELQDGLLYLERIIQDTQKENIIDIMKSDEELRLYANTWTGTSSTTTTGTI